MATAPKRGLYVVGDVHGRADLLEKILGMIDKDIVDHRVPDPQLVMVGDYIDRGHDSCGVLRELHIMSDALPERVTCLLGNHERMMLDFLDDPERNGIRWFRNGGIQTLDSYGIVGISEAETPERLRHIARDLRGALGMKLESWLRALPMMYRNGNICVVHAAVDPAVPLDEQEEETLLWGNALFFRSARKDGIWIVHGHTIVNEAIADAGRISVDTGAIFTGRLTAAAITEGSVRFLTS